MDTVPVRDGAQGILRRGQGGDWDSKDGGDGEELGIRGASLWGRGREILEKSSRFMSHVSTTSLMLSCLMPMEPAVYASSHLKTVLYALLLMLMEPAV